MSILHTPLVSSSWLKEHLNHPHLVVLDATIPKVSQHNKESSIPKKGIPKAQLVDLKEQFSDPSSLLPNTLPSPSQFEKAAQALGINEDSIIVVYDSLGIYSSARVWWLFQVMGHSQVAVLDGGLRGWKKLGLPLENLQQNKPKPLGNFKATFQAAAVATTNEVLAALNDPDKVILDARSAARFLGQEAEPRAGLRSGHMPQAVNLPYTQVLQNGYLKPLSSLQALFEPLATSEQELIFSCGSGVTACIPLLAAQIAGYKHLKLYDGSWSEWGQLEYLPIEQ